MTIAGMRTKNKIDMGLGQALLEDGIIDRERVES